MFQKLLFDRIDTDALTVTPEALELDFAVHKGKEGIVGAAAHIFTRMDVGAALADENVAGQNELAVGTLEAKALGLGITAVFRGTNALFMSE